MSLCNIKREVSEHDKESSLLSVYIGVERHVSMQCRERDVSVQCWGTCLSALKRDLQITSISEVDHAHHSLRTFNVRPWSLLDWAFPTWMMIGSWAAEEGSVCGSAKGWVGPQHHFEEHKVVSPDWAVERNHGQSALCQLYLKLLRYFLLRMLMTGAAWASGRVFLLKSTQGNIRVQR